MGLTIATLTLLASMTSDPLSPCNPGTVGQPNPALPNFNPYHPDADWDGDGIPNKDDPDIDGDGIPNCDDPERYTRPSMNPNWEIDRPIPIWDVPPTIIDGGYDDPATFEMDQAWLLRLQDQRGWDGGDNNPLNWLPPYNITGDPDGDGVINLFDLDDDGDGIPDINDPDHPAYDPTHPDSDMDCDGIKNSDDPDMDGDGIPNECDPNPGNTCEPDTKPLPGPDCNETPGPTDPNPGGGQGEPPTPPGQPGGPSRPDPPPPHDRPDPSPPADDPPPVPPPVHTIPPLLEPPPDPPKDSECCIAICARLDEIIRLTTFNSNIHVYTLNALQRFVGDGDSGGLWGHFYKRMISDPDSFRNRMDDGVWTVADLLLLVHDEIKWTNELLSGSGGGADMFLPRAPGPLGDVNNLTPWYDRQVDNLGEFGMDNLLPNIDKYSDPSTPPVWTFVIPFPAIGPIDHGPLSFTIDWAFYAPIRPIVNGMLFVLVSLNGVRILWEEFRRYG